MFYFVDMATPREAIDDDEKEHLRARLLELPAGRARFFLRDGSTLVGSVAREHNSNAVDADGRWRISAGVTLALEGGASRFLDLLDVTRIEALLPN